VPAGRESPAARAKREARRLTQALIADFTSRFAAADCRALVDYDFMQPGRHEAFIESGIWRDVCLRQIEFAADRTARLAADAGWHPDSDSPGPR